MLIHKIVDHYLINTLVHLGGGGLYFDIFRMGILHSVKQNNTVIMLDGDPNTKHLMNL